MKIEHSLSGHNSILDTHHHAWRYQSEEYSWMGPSDEVLKRDFSLADYLAEAQQLSIKAAVAVQSRQKIEETDFLIGIAQSSDLPHFVVGWFDLLAHDAEEVIKKYAQSRHLVGARHFLSLEPNHSLFQSEMFRERLQILANNGLTFDLLVRPDQLTLCANLAADLPQVTFVLDHLGNPSIGGDNTSWSIGLRELSALSNVYAKVSGLTDNAVEATTASSFDFAIDYAVECFGPDRLMFGSDWPVVNKLGSYGMWVEVVTNFFAKTAPEALSNVLWKNAIKAYNLNLGE